MPVVPLELGGGLTHFRELEKKAFEKTGPGMGARRRLLGNRKHPPLAN